MTREGADKFRSHELWHEFGREFHAENHLSTIDGDPHLRLRKLFKPAYSVSNLLSDIPLLIDIAQIVITSYQPGEEVAALLLFRKIVTEQLGRALTNYATGENLQHIITATRVSINVHVTKQAPTLMLKMPGYQKAKAQYLKMGHEIVAKHRNTTRAKKDLVDDILEASELSELQKMLGTEEQIAFAALGPFVAGLDTVANESTFLLYELLKHPEILAECIEEADQLFADGLPTSEKIREHGVLYQAMQETLRLHSIGEVVNHTANKDFAFAGHQIKEGDNVLIATTISHFLPQLFPFPYKFDIDRYTEGRHEHKQPGAYVPFSVGTHICLGAGAAEAQIVLAVATLLHLFNVEQIKPNARLRTKIDPTLTLGYAFRIRFQDRRHEKV